MLDTAWHKMRWDKWSMEVCYLYHIAVQFALETWCGVLTAVFLEEGGWHFSGYDKPYIHTITYTCLGVT